MSPVKSKLEMHVYLVDGSVRKFTQRDPGEINKILSDIKPNKLFDGKFLKLAEPSFMTIFPTKSVVRVDFVMQGHPEWASEIMEILQITPETFRMKCRPEHGAVGPEVQRKIGDPFVGFCEFDLINGQRLSVEIHTVVPAPSELGIMLTHLFATSTLAIKRVGGGFIFVNMDYAIRFRLHPRSPALLKTAIPVNRITDKEEFEKYGGTYY